jgi:hypothetical protein
MLSLKVESTSPTVRKGNWNKEWFTSSFLVHPTPASYLDMYVTVCMCYGLFVREIRIDLRYAYRIWFACIPICPSKTEIMYE